VSNWADTLADAFRAAGEVTASGADAVSDVVDLAEAAWDVLSPGDGSAASRNPPAQPAPSNNGGGIAPWEASPQSPWDVVGPDLAGPLPGGGLPAQATAVIAWLVGQPWARDAVRELMRRLGLVGPGASADIGTCRAMYREFEKQYPDAAKAIAVYACGSKIPIGLNSRMAEAVFWALTLWESGVARDAATQPSCGCK
jgi:hypothetical protein